ncbi:MAG: hypothetical protein HKO81_01005 [Flavobacteriaceae bacterium]|nr:hypothetical protein [Bacteroidia bacterium]NNL15202.1 hypothetical protein [Flavobacteriaceae bacterium]
MKQQFLIFILFLFTSCNYFDVKKTSSEAILNEELKSISWNDIDVYPAFEVCDSSSTTQERKYCFEETLIEHILKSLSKEKMIVSSNLKDTIFIDFKLSEKGDISILTLKVQKETLKALPNITSQIHSAMDSLPKIYPAIKRGQFVTTQFKLPIIIKSD